MAVRLRDIAKDLNLSSMTISKVLRGQTDVSAATKERVLKRVQELNYQPNVSARSLRTGQTHSIGMVVTTLAQADVAEMARGVAEVCRGANYSLVLSSTEADADEDEREVKLHLARQVDSLLFHPREDAADIPLALKSSSVPFVLMGHCPSRISALAVGVDDVAVGKSAAEHLLERRCRRIAYLRGPRTAVADLRFSGFLKAMRSSGLAVRLDWVTEIVPGETEYRSAFAAVERLLRGRAKPDGIAASTDLMAAGARDAALAAGLGVPNQVQVIGAGNQRAICEMGVTLSSVDTQPSEVGRRAARLALRLIERGESTSLRNVLVPPILVQRASTRRIV